LSWPPSSCPKCGNRIKGYDNIPVVSWLLLGAKCRNCKLKISAVYPLVELMTGVFFLAIWLIYGASWITPIYQLAVFGLLLATFIDIKEMWLPDRVTIGGMILFPIISALYPPLHGVEGWLSGLKASLIGLGAGFGLFWAIRVLGSAAFKQEAMGFGDVKLMGMLGALLGWQSILYITFFSALIGSLIGVTLLTLQRKGIRTEIPYGPYIVLAACSWILGGCRLWAAYIAWIQGF
jgi:leader peptidase (prepilin peptidase)/N-methyltransferase